LNGRPPGGVQLNRGRRPSLGRLRPRFPPPYPYAHSNFTARACTAACRSDQARSTFGFVDDLALRETVFENVEPVDFAELQGLAETAVRVGGVRPLSALLADVGDEG
jgi:hypothetical protein